MILLIDPSKDVVESIKAPKQSTLTKIVGAYEEYYRLKNKLEKQETYEDIEDKLGSSAVVIFIKGSSQATDHLASKHLLDQLHKLEI